MTDAIDPIRDLHRVGALLGSLAERVVFVGGAVTGLLITDPGSSSLRATEDLDVIIDVKSRTEYQVSVRNDLYARGFREDASEDAPICRWTIQGLLVDIMPISLNVLGFSNRWYEESYLTAQAHRFEDGLSIRVISAPCFVATKLEAFQDRGRDDCFASHDLEDVLAVVDGRPSLGSEIAASSTALRDHVAGSIRALLARADFRNALPGHLPGDLANQSRLPMLLDRLTKISRGE